MGQIGPQCRDDAVTAELQANWIRRNDDAYIDITEKSYLVLIGEWKS